MCGVKTFQFQYKDLCVEDEHNDDDGSEPKREDVDRGNYLNNSQRFEFLVSSLLHFICKLLISSVHLQQLYIVEQLRSELQPFIFDLHHFPLLLHLKLYKEEVEH